jgi:copper transport protein
LRHRWGIALVALVAAVAALALPAAAFAHAALLRTTPSASGTVNTSPKQLTLTYSEAVEPRFAIVSVTNAGAEQQTAGPPARAPANPDTLVVPLKKLAEGWYLVWWRVISADGHPVRGAFTFAVGPNPGPAPQFVIPSISETAATPRLIVARWLTFLFVMSAIGLLVFRLAIVRPVVRLVSGTSLRNVSVAFVVACALGLVMTPVYLLLSTAQFALRSWYDVGALFPLIRDSSFGRGYVDLELTFALFTLAGLIALWLDRPERERRSIVELLSLAGALLAAGAVVFVPGLAGHAAQASPRALALFLDATHVATGALWIGGLVGLLVLGLSVPRDLRIAGMAVGVPRFSVVALVSVNLLIASGVGRAIVELPTVSSLWETSYGKTILVKVALLAATMLIAAVNLLRTTPHLRASAQRPELGAPATVLLRRLVSVEAVIVAAVIVAAAVLSSLAPPSKALAALGTVSAHVGPGPVASVVERNGYTLQVRVTPNRAAQQNLFSLALNREGRPVTGANVTATFAMLDMEMGQQAYDLKESRPGVYTHAAPALVMVGHWGITFDVEPPGGQPFDATVVDRANG